MQKLPKELAAKAIDHLRSSDLSRVDNINGFFVGILNRIEARNMRSSSDDHTEWVSSSDIRRDVDTPASSSRSSSLSLSAWSGSNQPPPPPPPQAEQRGHYRLVRALSPAVQAQLQHMVHVGVIRSVDDEWGEKCYVILGQLPEGMAIEVRANVVQTNIDRSIDISI